MKKLLSILTYLIVFIFGIFFAAHQPDLSENVRIKTKEATNTVLNYLGKEIPPEKEEKEEK